MEGLDAVRGGPSLSFRAKIAVLGLAVLHNIIRLLHSVPW